MLLVGRDDEIKALVGLLAEAERGNGAVAVVRGGIASGKTALLHGFAAAAEAAGALVLAAAGSRAEHTLPLGVIGQILHDAPLSPHDATRIADLLRHTGRASWQAGDIGPDVVHELGMVLFGLAERGPVVIGIDDVEYVDRASLRCLLFLIWRIRSAQMLIVLNKCVVPEPPLVFEVEVLRLPHCRHLALSPLTLDMVHDVLDALLNREVARRFATAAYTVTGGNPLLVHALAEDHLAAGPTGIEESAGVAAGEAFQRAVLACLYSRTPELTRIARAIAVLDTLASASTVGRLVGLEPQAVEQAVGALTAAGLLDSYAFRHPAARAAVLHDLTTSGDADLHRRAAALLYGDGAPAATVADLLVVAGTVDGHWAIPPLLQAAEQALVSGQAATAVDYLRLANLAGGDEEQRIAVTAMLARAEWRLDPAVALRHADFLTNALRRGLLRGRHAFMPIRHLMWQGRVAEALSILDSLAEMADRLDPVTLAELRSAQLWVELSYPPFGAASPGPQRERDSDQPIASSPLMAVLGRRRGGPTGIDAAQRILQRERLDDATIGSKIAALVTLIYASRTDEADACCESLIEEAAARGAPTWQALFLGIRSEIAVRRGDLMLTEAYAREALRRLPLNSWGVAIGRPMGSLLLALTFRGAYEEAAELLAVPMPNPMFDTRVGLHYLYARGHYYLATGRPSAALGNFRACAELMAKWGLDQPIVVSCWRNGAADAHLQLAHPAREAGPEQLRHVAPREWRTRGVSLSSLAAASDLDQRARLLADAVDALQESGDQLQLAHALVDVGLACQAMGETERANGLLRQAHEIAEAWHAGSLLRRLAPPEPWQPADVHVLSDAELRVATLAAEGHTNREIARRLSITASTVEQHLTRVYRKLKVSRRWDLPKRLSTVGSVDIR
jgi:DNA-binding CsgD family transcriptional regulator